MARRRLRLVMTVLQLIYLKQIELRPLLFYPMYRPLIGHTDVLRLLAP